MVRKKRGKVLSEQKLKLFEMVKDISECIYKDYSQRSQFVLMNYFLYFCLLKFILITIYPINLIAKNMIVQFCYLILSILKMVVSAC